MKGFMFVAAWIAATVPLATLGFALAIPCEGWGCLGVGPIVFMSIQASIAVSVVLLVVVTVLYLRRWRWKRFVPMLLASASPGAFIALTIAFR